MKQETFTQRNHYSFITLLLAGLLFVSCGTYQSVYNNDGIYDDAPVQKSVVIVETKQEARTINDNYFSRELDKLNDNIDNDAIFTDAEEYTSYDNSNSEYTENSEEPWGYSSENNVVVQINYRDHWSWNNWNWNNWDYYRNRNYWRYRWGFNQGFYGNYVYQPYFYGYYRNNIHYGFYYAPYNNVPFYRNSRYARYYNNRYARNYYYGQRKASNRRATSYDSRRSNRYSKRDAASINSRVRSAYRGSNYKRTTSTRRSRSNSKTDVPTNYRRKSNSVKSTNKRGVRSTNSSRRYKSNSSNSKGSYKSTSSRRSYSPSRSNSSSRNSTSRSRSSSRRN